MTAVEVFQFPATGQQIRTLVRDGEPIFCVADVCRGLQHSNPSVALKLVDEDDRVMVDLRETDSPNLNRTSINPQMWFVTEPGFYALALASQAPGAKAFKRWITHDVLPSLRKTGRYEVAPGATLSVLPDMSTPEGRLQIAELLVDGARREIALGIERDQAHAQLAIAAPKAEYVDGFVNPGDDASLIRVFAAQLNVGEKSLRSWLIDRKVVYRRTVGQRWSKTKQKFEPEYEWLAYADYQAWFKPVDQPNAPRLHNGQPATTLYVTPVGKVQIRRLLMKHPIDKAA